MWDGSIASCRGLSGPVFSALLTSPGLFYPCTFTMRSRGPIWSMVTSKVLNIWLSKELIRNFPDGSVVKISPSNTGSAGSIPGWRAKNPYASQPKAKTKNNRSNIVTNSIKTLKYGPPKKKKKLKKSKELISRHFRSSMNRAHCYGLIRSNWPIQTLH